MHNTIVRTNVCNYILDAFDLSILTYGFSFPARNALDPVY